MSSVTLTPHQQEALTWAVDALTKGASLIAVRGLAGTGKTTMIPALRDALTAHKLASVVGSPTHRAAMILRSKGISDAETVHSLALTPYFTADYAMAARWLGEEVPCKWDIADMPHDQVEGMPWLLYQTVQPQLDKAHNLKRERHHPVKKRLAKIGLHGREHFAGFGPKAGHGVLIIDEASMVGEKMLALCMQAYTQICLVGDPGQLPPVKDEALLASVPGVDLTEVHRQAQDSGIIRLAYTARALGTPDAMAHPHFWREPLDNGTDVRECRAVAASMFLDAPLLVWRNETRLAATKAIREALGAPRDRVVVGEPLVCRATSPEDRAEGFYNNALYRVTAVNDSDPRLVTVEDAFGEESDLRLHLEELDGREIDPRAIPFRFGYALTCHTAQGGEWPQVYVSLPDLIKYANFCMHTHREQEIAQWAYTAITRAKTTLYFLTTHVFTPQGDPMASPKVAPPSAPLMTDPPPSPLDPPDDIIDPVVPPATVAALTPVPPPPEVPDTLRPFEPLMQGFLQVVLRDLQNKMGDYHSDLKSRLGAMDGEHLRLCATLETIVKLAQQAVTAAGERNEHAAYQLSDALLKLQEHGVKLRGEPYTVQVESTTPEGYRVTFTAHKEDPGTLLDAVQALVAWLAQQGYQGVAA